MRGSNDNSNGRLRYTPGEETISDYGKPHPHQAAHMPGSTKHVANALDQTRNKDLILSDQAADDEIQSLFRDVASSIKTWSFAFQHSPPEPISRPSADQAARLRKIICGRAQTDEISSLVAQSSVRRQLAKGWVHQILHDRILGIQDRGLDGLKTRSEDIWMGNTVAQAMMAIEKALLEEVYDGAHEHKSSAPEALTYPLNERQFHSWRSYTASMIARSCLAHDAPTTDWYQEQVNEIKEQIWALVGAWLPKSAQATSLAGLDEVISSAIALSCIIRQQRAYWTVAFPESSPASSVVSQVTSKTPSQGKSPILFDPETMRDGKDGEEELDGNCQRSLENHVVELMISPALFKRGDASGNKYDEESCFMPAEVRCQLPSTV
jgi:hypothetical protein